MKFHALFSVFGIEAEYMIVNKNTLKVSPIADKILSELNGGTVTNEVEFFPVAWSNELVNHVLEIKYAKPLDKIEGLDQSFHKSILKVNSILSKYDSILMPTAMHPWFNPNTEMMLWPHDQSDIYTLYNKIFDCRGHGWSNLQSVHINLPYADESEFKKLHAAIRAILPIIPALAASSPFHDGKPGKYCDNRLAFYEKNQAKVPSIAGNVIPESVNGYDDYKKILEEIYQDISPYDPEGTLQHPWLNSRGAIVKFDVQAIEIRLMDIQESPYMDFCLITLIVELVRTITLSNEKLDLVEDLSDSELRLIYDEAKQRSPSKIFKEYFEIFDIRDATNLREFIQMLIQSNLQKVPKQYHEGLTTIQRKGNLAERLTDSGLSQKTYEKVIECLMENSIFQGV